MPARRDIGGKWLIGGKISEFEVAVSFFVLGQSEIAFAEFWIHFVLFAPTSGVRAKPVNPLVLVVEK